MSLFGALYMTIGFLFGIVLCDLEATDARLLGIRTPLEAYVVLCLFMSVIGVPIFALIAASEAWRWMRRRKA